MNDMSDKRDHRTPQLPDFELLRQVGEGGFGTVWLARNRATGMLRAIKLIPLGCSASRADRERTSLVRMEQHLGRRHDHLIEIHHVGQTDDFLYYVMDPADDVAGERASDSPDYRPATLRSLLEQGPIHVDACERYTRELLDALACLHGSGMAHRDVKPSNCLFIDGRLKLADFGLLTEALPCASRLGTLTYMPPDGRMDTRADVYAAGLVVYEMITGQPAERFPHLGPRAAEFAVNPVLARLNHLALGAVQPRAEDRFADARAMLAELNASRTRPAGRNGPLVAVVALACLLAIGVAVGWTIWLRPPRGEGNLAGETHQPNAVDAAGPRVAVNFVTEPLFEATIWLDDKQLIRPDGTPYTTPCTVPDVPAGPAKIVFRHAEAPERDGGLVDFRAVREVKVHWEAEP